MPVLRPVEQPLDRPIRLAVLISGGGTTLLNLQQLIQEGQLSAEIPLVIASRAQIAGVERARRAQLRCELVLRKEYADTDAFSEAIFTLCRESAIDLVVCGGFLSLLTIAADFENRVINIHPSLIPSFCGWGFYGERVHTAVLARGAKVSGCTAHFVDNQYDHGPIILQRAVDVLEDDTPDTLAERVFAAECLALPEAIRLYSTGRLEVVDGRTVRVRPATV